MKVEIKTVAVIGAGTMGQGIAQVCALGGFATILMDINLEVLQAGILAIKNNLETAVEKNKLTVEEK